MIQTQKIHPVKKVWFYSYHLKPKIGEKIRQGALLKWEFSKGQIGYSDLHPWPEKGEYDLKIQMEKLKNKTLTPLLTIAKELAFIDAQARAGGLSLLNGLKIPSSHYLISHINSFTVEDMEDNLKKGFKIFKVKLKDPLEESSRAWINLAKTFKGQICWRLDFNSYLSLKVWQEWKQKYLTSPVKENIDFIEAPFDYEERLWQKNKNLALDVWSDKENSLPVSVLVWKPARKPYSQLMKKNQNRLFKRVVFTHSLAHPLDQLATAFLSASFYHAQPQFFECGAFVQTSHYEKHPFSLPSASPQLKYSVDGPGFGFSSLLKKLPWKKWI